jgi:hypothetical protein
VSPQGVPVKSYSVDANDIAYFAAFSDLKNGVPPDQIAAMFGRERNSLAERSDGAVVSEKQISLNGNYPGREFTLNTKSAGPMRARIYLVEQKLYEVYVIGRKDLVESAESTAFLDSFKLGVQGKWVPKTGKERDLTPP